MTPQLQDIIDEAYRLFAPYRVQRSLGVCTDCCVTPLEVERLIDTDVRDIPRQLIYTWNHAAKTAQPNIAEFKHFLPRFLDLIARFDWPAHSVELSLQGFRHTAGTDWPPPERRLLDDFAHAFFDHCLKTYPLPEAQLDEILIMLVTAGADPDHLLDQWQNASDTAALRHLGQVLHFSVIPEDKLPYNNPFAAPDLNRKLSDWLQNKDVIAGFAGKIEAQIERLPKTQDEALSDLCRAYEALLGV